MAYHSKNPRLDSTILTDEGVGAVTSPAAGSHKVVNRSGVLYTVNSSGTEAPMGAGPVSQSAKSADYTITDSDLISVIVMTTGGTDRTVTLPTLADNQNRVITIKKIDGMDADGTGKCIIDGENTETIDGDATVDLYAAGDNIVLKGGSTRWEILKLRQTEFLSNDGDLNFATGNADDTTHFYYASTGTIFPSGSFTGGRVRRVRCLSAPKNHTSMIIEIDAYNVDQWQSSTGSIYGGAQYIDNYNAQNNCGIGRIDRVSSTDYDVNLGRYAYLSLNNWAAGHASMRWRIKKQTII